MNLESKIFALIRDYKKHSSIWCIFWIHVIPTLYKDIQNQGMRRNLLHNRLVNRTCLFASIHSFNVIEVMVLQFFPFQLESICY